MICLQWSHARVELATLFGQTENLFIKSSNSSSNNNDNNLYFRLQS